MDKQVIINTYNFKTFQKKRKRMSIKNQNIAYNFKSCKFILTYELMLLINLTLLQKPFQGWKKPNNYKVNWII